MMQILMIMWYANVDYCVHIEIFLKVQLTYYKILVEGTVQLSSSMTRALCIVCHRVMAGTRVGLVYVNMVQLATVAWACVFLQLPQVSICCLLLQLQPHYHRSYQHRSLATQLNWKIYDEADPDLSAFPSQRKTPN